MLKLVKLQSFVAKLCKMTFGPNVLHFPARIIQINTKFANFIALYFPHFTTFRGQALQLLMDSVLLA